MKSIKLILYFGVFMIMAALTAIPYLGGDTPSLAGGSIAFIMTMIVSNAFISIFLLSLFGLILYFYYKAKVKIVFLALSFFFWLLSGRMIGILPDGRLSTGWFYIETGRVDICDHKMDCETVMVQQTKIEKLLFWRVRIKNKTIDHTLFVGPFIWSNAMKVFNETFMSEI